MDVIVMDFHTWSSSCLKLTKQYIKETKAIPCNYKLYILKDYFICISHIHVPFTEFCTKEEKSYLIYAHAIKFI